MQVAAAPDTEQNFPPPLALNTGSRVDAHTGHAEAPWGQVIGGAACLWLQKQERFSQPTVLPFAFPQGGVPGTGLGANTHSLSSHTVPARSVNLDKPLPPVGHPLLSPNRRP